MKSLLYSVMYAALRYPRVTYMIVFVSIIGWGLLHLLHSSGLME